MTPSVERVARPHVPGRLPRSTIAVASFGAAATHAAVAGPHLQEWGPAGSLFLVAATAQWIVGLLVLAVSSKKLEGVAGAVGGALIAVWAMSRTVGLPVGSEPWIAETVGPADAVSVLFEAAVVVSAVVARKRESAMPRNPGALIGSTAAAALAGIVLGSGHHGGGHALLHLGGVTAAAAGYAAYLAWEIGANGAPRFSLRLRS